MRIRGLLVGFLAVVAASACAPAASAPGPAPDLLISPSPTTPFTSIRAERCTERFPTAGTRPWPIRSWGSAAASSPRPGWSRGRTSTAPPSGCPRPGSTRRVSACRRTTTTSPRTARCWRGSRPPRTAASNPIASTWTAGRRSTRPTLPGTLHGPGRGVCRIGAHATRFAYFVAAPGFGPVHEIDPEQRPLRRRRRGPGGARRP